jgi:hypothetical protein
VAAKALNSPAINELSEECVRVLQWITDEQDFQYLSRPEIGALVLKMRALFGSKTVKLIAEVEGAHTRVLESHKISVPKNAKWPSL